MNNIKLKIENLNVSMGKREILRNVNLTINSQNENIVSIQGKSGYGKTTLLRCIAQLERYKGNIFINDKNIKDISKEEKIKTIGMVFQNPANRIFSSTVEDEIAFALENMFIDVDEINRIIEDVLHRLNMTEYRYTDPRELSGGYKKLLYIAVVLAMKPKIYLLDEVFSELDDSKRILVKNILQEESNDSLIIMVDHFEENLKICQHRYVIKEKEVVQLEMVT